MSELFQAKTPHHGPRKPMMIVIHGTEVDDATSRAILTGQTAHEGSAHYYIDDKGEILQLLDETMRAWHAGKSRWSGFSDVNSLSVGIELLAISKNRKFNDKETFYTDAQIVSLAQLCKEITTRWNIHASHIVGHQDIDSGRIYEPVVADTIEEMQAQFPLSLQKKYDPGPFFPWQKLSDLGVGAWHELKPVSDDKIITDEKRIEDFKTKLTLYGYDTRPSPTGRIWSDVVTAFQTHFLPWNICGQVTEQSIEALDILLQKKFA